MKIKLINLINSKESLDRLLSINMPAKYSFRIAKMIDVLNDNFIKFENEKQKLIKKYGENYTKDKNKFRVKKEFLEEYKKEYFELCNKEIELNFILLSNDFLDHIEMSPKDIYKIMFLLENNNE